MFEQLDEKAPLLFLAGGALYAVLAANRLLATFVGTSYWFASTFAWAGTVLVLLGLLGLYPALVERRPYLSRVGAAVALIAAFASFVVLVGELIKAAGLLSEAPGPLWVSPFVGMFGADLAFLVFGGAVLLTGTHPRVVGGLLLLLPITLPLWFTVLSSVPSYYSDLLALVVYFGIGFALWTDIGRRANPANTTESSA